MNSNLQGKETIDDEIIRNYLKGRDTKDARNTSLLGKWIPHNRLIVFVSSTFTDTHAERDILHQNIVPHLQELGKDTETQVILYDMRFGVKDENTLDHMTWLACREGIEQCYEQSDGMFFLSLQGDKYGYRPIPKYIEKETLDKAMECKADNSDLIRLAREWYKLEENAEPLLFQLNSLTANNKNTFFDQVLGKLRDELLDSVCFEKLLNNGGEEALLVNRSVTEWEVMKAFDLCANRCFWIRRSFDREDLKSLKIQCSNESVEWKRRAYEALADTLDTPSLQMKLDILRQKMESVLQLDGSCSIINIKNITPQQYFKKDEKEMSDQVSAYFADWESSAKNRLMEEVTKVKQLKFDWITRMETNFHLPYEHLEEILHHCNVSHSKSSQFYGREELFHRIVEKLRSQKIGKKNERSVSLALIGRSGCGKTSLMSKIAVHFAEINTTSNIPVIVRYCGTSRFSLHGIDLIQSICLQIFLVSEAFDKLTSFLEEISEQSYAEAVKKFQSLMKKTPIYLFIDSLDQLSNRNEARSNLTFLQDLQLHKNSKLIVSCLPDEYDEKEKKWIYAYYCEKALRQMEVDKVLIENEGNIIDIMQQILRNNHRVLSPGQWSIVSNAVQVEPTVLYVNLAVEVIRKWKHSDTDPLLRPTVKGIILQLFSDWEREFGKELVSNAFAFITFSRGGINDIEMQHLLSLHLEVLKEVFQYSTLQYFPIHVWLRLKSAIKHIIVEKESHCMKWYHRQIWETAQERYVEKKVRVHEIMGRYFANLISSEERKTKQIADQPLTLNLMSIWYPESIVNKRRVQESFYNLMEANMFVEAAKQMCSVEMVCATILAGDGYFFVFSLGELFRKREKLDDPLQIKVDHYYRWVRKEITAMAKNPRQRVCSTVTMEPYLSEARKDMKQIIPELRNSIEKVTTESLCIVQQVFMGKTSYDQILMNWGVGCEVGDVAWSPDCRKILSSSADGVLRVWDVDTGEVLKALNNNGSDVYSVCWSLDGRKIASACSKVKIWEAETGDVIGTIPVKTRIICWSADGHMILAGLKDGIIQSFNVLTGQLIKTFEGHKEEVTSIKVNADGSKLVSGSLDGIIKIWDMMTAEVLKSTEFSDESLKPGTVDWDGDNIIAATNSSIVIQDSNTLSKIQELRGLNVLSLSVMNEKIICGSNDKTITVWNKNTGELIDTMKIHSSSVNSVGLNSDATKLVSGSDDKTIKISEVGKGYLRQTLKELQTQLTQHRRPVYSISLCADRSKLVSGDGMWRANIWDIASGKIIYSLRGHSSSIDSVAWSKDQTKIATGSSDQMIKIWDGISGNLMKTLKGHVGSVLSLIWNLEGTMLLSSSNDKKIYLWDVETGEKMKSFEGHTAAVHCISWLENDVTFVSCSSDHMIKIWNVTSGKMIKSLERHKETVNSVSNAPDGSLIVSGSNDKTIKIWEVHTGKVLHTLKGHSDSVLSVCWNGQRNQIASGSKDYTVKVWNAETGDLIITFEGHTHYVKCVIWNLDGSMVLSGSLDGKIKFWEVPTEDQINKTTGHTKNVRCVSWNEDGSKIVSGSDDKTIKIWDVATGEVLKTSKAHLSTVTCVRWSFDGTKIVSGADDKLKIWKAESMELIKTLEGHTGVVNSVCWSSDGGKIASCSKDTTIKIWEVKSGNMLTTLKGHIGSVDSIHWSADENKIVSISDGDKTMKVWDISTASVVKRFESHTGLQSVSWSVDGSKLISGSSDKTVKILDIVTGEIVKTLVGHTGIVHWVHLSDDGSKIITAADDKSVKIWDVITGELLRSFRCQTSLFYSACLSPDNSMIASPSNDKTVKIGVIVHH